MLNIMLPAVECGQVQSTSLYSEKELSLQVKFSKPHTLCNQLALMRSRISSFRQPKFFPLFQNTQRRLHLHLVPDRAKHIPTCKNQDPLPNWQNSTVCFWISFYRDDFCWHTHGEGKPPPMHFQHGVCLPPSFLLCHGHMKPSRM